MNRTAKLFRKHFHFCDKGALKRAAATIAEISLRGPSYEGSRGRRVSQAADRSGELSPFQSAYSTITKFGMHSIIYFILP
jgi:hypothetical protein